MSERSAPAFAAAVRNLQQHRYTWLVTGVAGFIGSHLAESLISWGQNVVGIDNFATGRLTNVELLYRAASLPNPSASPTFVFVEGDITDAAACSAAFAAASERVDFVLHHAALGSVPRSMKDPMSTHRANVDGTLQVLLAARDAGVRRVVYASSSSVYGDNSSQPKRVGSEGRPLSPYALSKAMNEQHAELVARTWGLSAVGLRYFNVFGPRQDPHGPYAAVIPRWVEALVGGKPCTIYGDGNTSRDFCYVGNVIQANLLAALAELPPNSGSGVPSGQAPHMVCNIAVGESTSLNDLYSLIQNGLLALNPSLPIDGLEPVFAPFRPGDIMHSLADIEPAKSLLGYAPTHTVADGLRVTLTAALRPQTTALLADCP